LKYYPFYRIRTISKIEIPYSNGSVGQMIELIRCLLTFRELFENSYINLKEIIKICNYNDCEEDDDVISENYDAKPIIMTINSPKKLKSRN